ncbi:receptor activity-modifying protein 3 [Pleuronectes platessa]|uniref:receptor activity-modifying protein 3 n=1 Tax=Pleuronectes platessa TaxID=8262 RepID=UPI00232A2391|nr:receptor activity-modifying protein 3 [Pleuronectes platessa]
MCVFPEQQQQQLRFSSKLRVDRHSVMDHTHESAVLRKLFVVGILVNVWMMRGLSATESFTTELPKKPCNESRLQWEVEVCGEGFKRDMAHIDPQHRCNLTHFISEYHLFTLCTETKASHVHCYWPNPLVEVYIIHIHKHFFSNCSMDHVEWVDPPENTLTALILVPVFLTMAMIALVVWCSKRSDNMA